MILETLLREQTTNFRPGVLSTRGEMTAGLATDDSKIVRPSTIPDNTIIKIQDLINKINEKEKIGNQVIRKTGFYDDKTDSALKDILKEAGERYGIQNPPLEWKQFAKKATEMKLGVFKATKEGLKTFLEGFLSGGYLAKDFQREPFDLDVMMKNVERDILRIEKEGDFFGDAWFVTEPSKIFDAQGAEEVIERKIFKWNKEKKHFEKTKLKYSGNEEKIEQMKKAGDLFYFQDGDGNPDANLQENKNLLGKSHATMIRERWRRY